MYSAMPPSLRAPARASAGLSLPSGPGSGTREPSHRVAHRDGFRYAPAVAEAGRGGRDADALSAQLFAAPSRKRGGVTGTQTRFPPSSFAVTATREPLLRVGRVVAEAGRGGGDADAVSAQLLGAVEGQVGGCQEFDEVVAVLGH